MLNKKIDKKLDELVSEIQKLEEVQLYKQIEAKIHSNEDIMNKYQEVKDIQKKLVNARHYQTNVAEIEGLYESNLSELEDIPIVNQFLHYQNEVNELVQEITNLIELEINNN